MPPLPARSCALALALALALPACKADKPSGGPAPSAVAETSAPTNAAASAASATASAGAAASAAPGEPPPTALHLVAKTDGGRLAAVPSARGVLIVAFDPFRDDPPALLVEGDSVTPVRGLFSKLGPQEPDARRSSQVMSFFGRYPDRFYARLSEIGGRSGSISSYYAYDGGAWKRDDAADPSEPALVGGKLVTVQMQTMGPPRVLLEFNGIDAEFPNDDPESEDACIPRAFYDGRLALAATPADDLFLLTIECGDTPRTVIDVFPKGAKKSKSTTKVPVLGKAPSLFARTATEAYLAGIDDGGQGYGDKGYLAKFDGSKWTLETRPLPPIGEMAGAEDGTLWLVGDDRLIRRAPDGAFTELQAPAEAKDMPFEHVVAVSGTQAWVFGGGFVLSTRKPKEVLTLDASALAPKAATAACKTVFVQLYGVTKKTPPGFDFPKTREAMKGHKELEGVRFVVTKDDRFGAVVRSLDEGKAVQKLAQAGVKGSRPQLLCMKADEVREVKFDLATGKPR